MAGEEVPAPAFDDTRSESDSKHTHGHGVHQSWVGSGSFPSTPTDSRKRRNDGIDMNKKPNRMKKHRPKVLDDSKPKQVSTPRPKTPKPVSPNPLQTSCMQSSTDKPKKVPMAQSPRASTPTPKTPNQVQERMKHPRKCKRSLDFDYHREFQEQPPSFGEFDYFSKIVNSNSNRNTLRSSSRCLKASKDMLGDNNKQRCWQDIISVIRNQEKHASKLVYCYQRRRKSSCSISTTSFIIIPKLQVYQRKLKCLQSSKKSGPNFPTTFKKKRGKRKKSTTIGDWWYILQDVKDGNSHVKRSHVQITGKGVHIRVNKSKHHKGVVKPKKRKPLHTSKTENNKEEWWERQRKVFRGRVDSFIAKMHLIQGNRRFSPWKGSVVDSVVGAYLTQNVSDHLSSSAFMSLVARFPVKSRGKETEKDIRTISCAEPTTKPKEEGEKNEHWKHSESEFVVDKKSTPEEPRIVDSEVTIEQRVDAVNNHQIPLDTEKKKSRIEEKQQETKTDWESLRRSYCKTGGKGTNGNNMDAVDWDAVRRATVEEVAETIVERGMNNKLAVRIKAFLERMVIDHGTIDLEWLRDVPPDKAKEFLMSIRGIGLKSVECIRLLTLHHLAFPVDTNVGRVATRLGWVPLQPLPEEVQIHLLNSYPMVNNIQKYLFPRLCTLDQKTLYELHYQLITFGKVFCTKRTPNCNACPMRAECRHYASAFASARLTLPGLEGLEGGVTSIVPVANEQNHGTPPFADLQLNNLSSSYDARNNDPIVEVPPSPVPDIEETMPIIADIEDFFCESDEEIPTIRLNTQELRETLKDTLSLPEAEMSKALVAFTTQPPSIPRMKFVAKSRTVHFVYELPDSHPILVGFDKREHDDPSPYLLAIWLPGETEYTENIACNSSNEETVKGTILIPCRTANRGKFPLNGTYFQVNEVFADDETSRIPMDVPRCQLWNLPRRYLGCGTSATSIFKALSTSDIQRCFWKGSICVRGFNKKTRQPRPLHRRFHISTTAVAADGKKIWKK